MSPVREQLQFAPGVESGGHHRCLSFLLSQRTIFKKGERTGYLKVEKQESYLGWGRSKFTRRVAVSFEYLSALIWLDDIGKNVRERSLDWRLSLFVPKQVQLRKRGFLGLGKVLKEAGVRVGCGTTSWGPRRQCQKDGGGVLGQSVPTPALLFPWETAEFPSTAAHGCLELSWGKPDCIFTALFLDVSSVRCIRA